MHARGHRRISLVGHSQGGMIGRWALKYWPDTRAMVDDYVGLASSNHGTQVFNAECAAPTGCDAANWQQSQGSHFLTALNAGGETYRGISYTEIATTYDEVVVPYTSVFLAARRNVTDTTVQRLCPTEVVDHFGMSYDNAAWLIGLDALTHAGPAKLGRVPTATCGRPLMPAVDPTTFPAHVAAALAQTARSSVVAPQLAAEPALRPYAR
jgi:triacylglycerol esterase/lipase EstA (alpha/beta hydrolase family)